MKKSYNDASLAETTAVSTALQSDHNVQMVPRLTGDWNLNLYTQPSADNIPAESTDGFDIDAFPISSIFQGNRPTKGIVKALVGQAVVNGGYGDVNQPRFYVGDDKDVYKYWVSPVRTNASGVFPTHTDTITKVRPHVTYTSILRPNKIVIKIENTWASPLSYDILVRTTVGGAWSVIATNPAVTASDGTVTLYFNGTSWVSARPASLVTTNVAGIMVRVSSLTGGRTKSGAQTTYQKRNASGVMTTYTTDGTLSNFSLIAIEPHLEVNLSDRLIQSSDMFDMAEASDLFPIGTLTTNEADIVLANEDGVFNIENSASSYYGLLHPNVQMNLEYIYTVSGIAHRVQGFSLVCGSWPEQSDGTVTLHLEDSSKFLKVTKPRATMYRGKPVAELVWRILDSVGFVNYNIDLDDTVAEHTIPIFWVDGTLSAWEILDSLAKGTQTAIYFDGFGVLQVKTRSSAFRDTATPSWELTGQVNGSRLPDIVDWTPVGQEEANKIEVVYKNTKWKTGTNGVPGLSKVWEPESSLTIRSSPLVRTLDTDDTHFYLNQKDVLVWPFSGKVNIGGEVISYEGKQFVYYTGATGATKNYTTVISEDEKRKIGLQTPEQYRFKNHYNGGLKVKERELWNTKLAVHEVDADNWTKTGEVFLAGNLISITSLPGFTFNKEESTVTLNTHKVIRESFGTYLAVRGVGSTAFKTYGTKFKFNKDASSTHQQAGIGMYVNGTKNDGYYVEVRPSGTIDGKKRKLLNEVNTYSRKDGKWTLLSKGVPVAITQGVWYELDVNVNASTQDTISVWLNGQFLGSSTTTAATKQTATGKLAMFARGKTNVDYEFVYGIDRFGIDPPDDFGFNDLRYGDIRGGAWEREHVYQWKTRWKKIRKNKWVKQSYLWNAYLFDEFGSYVHEIREFDVKFDPAPVLNSTLFHTNNYAAAVMEYNSTPFGASFVVVNTSRDHAILSGSDALSYGGVRNNINQVFTILGRDLEVANEQTVTRSNPLSIRQRGQVEVQMISDWLQTEVQAKALADWMAKHWSRGVDHVEVTLFGNPLIEVCDVLTVNYAERNLAAATHKYFVVGVTNNFDRGLETTLTLRRVNTATDSELT